VYKEEYKEEVYRHFRDTVASNIREIMEAAIHSDEGSKHLPYFTKFLSNYTSQQRRTQPS
jgi:hypothetical protein